MQTSQQVYEAAVRTAETVSQEFQTGIDNARKIYLQDTDAVMRESQAKLAEIDSNFQQAIAELEAKFEAKLKEIMNS